MRILYFVRTLFFKYLEKFIACAAIMLIVVSLVQGINTLSFDGKSGSDSITASVSCTKPMKKSVEKSKSRNAGKGKKTLKERKKTVKIKKSKKKTKKKAMRKKKSVDRAKSKKKLNTYTKTSNNIVSRLNSAKLKPKEFLKGKDEKILKKHLNKIIDDDMSNYKKAKTCYDYLINNTHYSYGGWGNAIESVLEKGYGTCTEYSYVYMAMMKYLGFNAKTVDGSTAMAAGGYGYHMWTEVKLNGNTYVFDPQVEDDMTNGKINYYRFCKTYSEVQGSYIK